MSEVTLRQLLHAMSLRTLYAFALDVAASVDNGEPGRSLIEKIFDAIKAKPVMPARVARSATASILPAPATRALALRMGFFAASAAIAISAVLAMRLQQ
jgi:hypothetical protein